MKPAKDCIGKSNRESISQRNCSAGARELDNTAWGPSRPLSKADSRVAYSQSAGSLFQPDFDKDCGFELHVFHQPVNFAGPIVVQFLIETHTLNLTPVINALIHMAA